MRSLTGALLFLWAGVAPAMAQDEGEPLKVLVSIRPLHSIVSAVMGDTGTPDLLITGAASPHAYALRPSDARKLEAAEIVFWTGPTLETFLETPLRTLAGDASLHALEDAPGLHLLPLREGGLWDVHDHADHAHDHEDDAAHETFDPHFWLDPENGIAMAEAIADVLSEADPGRAERYAANAGAFAARVATLDSETAMRLAAVREAAYIVFHDAYQYFEDHYGLSPQGSVTVASERPVGTRRVVEIRERIAGAGVACIFSPPQFSPRLVAVLIENSTARSATLDDLGTDIEAGPMLYETLLRQMADDYLDCLGG